VRHIRPTVNQILPVLAEDRDKFPRTQSFFLDFRLDLADLIGILLPRWPSRYGLLDLAVALVLAQEDDPWMTA
jgi:hypothetical protein